MDSIRLIGAEDVSQAARNMAGAAESMKAAANHFDNVMDQHHRWADEWLARFETAVKQMPLMGTA